MVFVIFSDALVITTTDLCEVRISYFILILFILVLFPLLKKIYFSKTFIIAFIFIICSSLFNIYLGNDRLFFVLKQTLGISLNAFAFYVLIKFNNEDIKRLVKIYLNIACAVGLIGIIQEIGYILHIQWLFDYRVIFPKILLPTVFYTEPLLRVNSILSEPASFSIAMMPAFSIALFSFRRKNFNFINRGCCFVIITAFSSFLFYYGIHRYFFRNSASIV